MKIRQYNADYLDGVIRVWESATKVGHPFLSEKFIRSEKENIPSVYLPSGDT